MKIVIRVKNLQKNCVWSFGDHNVIDGYRFLLCLITRAELRGVCIKTKQCGQGLERLLGDDK